MRDQQDCETPEGNSASLAKKNSLPRWREGGKKGLYPLNPPHLLPRTRDKDSEDTIRKEIAAPGKGVLNLTPENPSTNQEKGGPDHARIRSSADGRFREVYFKHSGDGKDAKLRSRDNTIAQLF